jgi:hypothetical protein
MSIVATEVESVHGAPTQQRMIFYRCRDDQGVWHSWGPVMTVDQNFDVEGHKAGVAIAVAEGLAEQEFEEVIR